MKLNSYFSDFLADIRLQSNHRDDLKRGHKTLRKRLNDDEDLSPIIVSTFLQGSYRRATAIRPYKGKRADVDIIIVTTIPESVSPEDAMAHFEPFLDKHYEGKWRPQGRSFGIELSYVDLDVVITSAPSEADEEALKSASVRDIDTIEDIPDWRLVEEWLGRSERYSDFSTEAMLKRASQQPEWMLEPLKIPDRETECWQRTHPLEQIRWTRDKNGSCNTHYVNVVKAIKWSRRIRYTDSKYPKGYPLEHIIGDYCPNNIGSVAEGVTLTLENIVAELSTYYSTNEVPVFPDRGVSEHDVWKRISVEAFKTFYEQVEESAEIARRALDEDTIKESALAWQELFGSRFPDPPDDDDGDDNSRSQQKGGFTPRKKESDVGKGRYA